MKEKEEQTKENATERLYSRQPTKHTHTRRHPTPSRLASNPHTRTEQIQRTPKHPNQQATNVPNIFEWILRHTDHDEKQEKRDRPDERDRLSHPAYSE